MIAHGPMDRTPRHHLLGWGESAPPIIPEKCRICGAKPNGQHTVTMLGVYETLGILKRGDMLRIEVRPIVDARAKSTRIHDL